MYIDRLESLNRKEQQWKLSHLDFVFFHASKHFWAEIAWPQICQATEKLTSLMKLTLPTLLTPMLFFKACIQPHSPHLDPSLQGLHTNWHSPHLDPSLQGLHTNWHSPHLDPSLQGLHTNWHSPHLDPSLQGLHTNWHSPHLDPSLQGLHTNWHSPHLDPSLQGLHTNWHSHT